MRIASALSIFAALALALVAPVAASAQAGPGFAAFDQAIEDTKTAMMADPQLALAKSKAATAQAEKLPRSTQGEVARATALWLQIEANLGLNRLPEAQRLVVGAIPLVERSAPQTKLHGDLMRSRGAIAGLSGRAQDALRDYLAAYRIFGAAKVVRSQAITLQDIGQIYFEAGDYERVVRYYAQAKDLYNADPGFALTTHNNLGETLRMLRRGAEAEREYLAALDKARELESRVLEVRILNNLALVQLENGKLGEATRNAQRALKLAQSGEAADWRDSVYGVLAKIAAARGEDRRAAALLDRAFAKMPLDKTELVYKEFHQLGADLFERLGRPQRALAHLRAYQRLDSEARTLTASASSQLLAARFDFTNQNLRISQLKQGQLQRDVKIQRQRATLFSGLAIAGGIVLALVLVAFFWIRRSRNEVRATNAVLTVTNTKLEKALKAKTEFLATTSHEIRTPLNGILGMTQILLAGRKLDSEAREQVQVVHGAGEAMRALVDDILDAAKMETGQVEVAHEPVGFRHVLEDAARLWSGHALGKGLVLDLDLDRAPSRIRSDGERLRQIVGNLLSNAIKFTPAGTVTLRAWAEEGDHTLVVEVRDTGIGIPADHLERVFEAFHQVDGGMNRQFSGTGLGLSICRSLATALGGSIILRSEVGHGSTFTLRLPLERLEDEPLAMAGSRPTDLAQARLLLVEGNAMTEGVMRSLIEPVAVSVDCVPDGSAAIAAVNTGTADHVLIEAKSSRVGELEPLASLHMLIEACNAADVRVSVLFAPSDEYPVEKIAVMGATQLILKPVGGIQLIAALASAYNDEASSVPLSSAA